MRTQATDRSSSAPTLTLPDASSGVRRVLFTLLHTDPTNGILLFQRFALAAVMLPHGLQKTLGWFGGYGFAGTYGFLTAKAGLPAPIAVLVILGESLGALMLAFGLASRVAAFGIAAIMLGAIATVHLSNGFFINWSGTQAGEGIEYHLLALALALPILVRGGGRASLDASLARRA